MIITCELNESYLLTYLLTCLGSLDILVLW